MADWLARHLDVLQVESSPPGLEALQRLAMAHVQRVPFENISAILQRQAAGSGAVPPLNLDGVLESWLERRGGGVCFEVAGMVDRVLTELGYRTHPVLAQISFPGSHQANLAELRHFTVDGKTTERVSDKTDYAALAAGTFGVPNLPINAARAALAARR